MCVFPRTVRMCQCAQALLGTHAWNMGGSLLARSPTVSEGEDHRSWSQRLLWRFSVLELELPTSNIEE